MTQHASPAAWRPLGFRHILFPTDGSRDSHVAVLQLVPLALGSEAAVTVLEVIESRRQVMARASSAGWLPTGDGYLTEANARELVEIQRRAATGHVRAIQAELKQAGVADVDGVVTEGPAGPTIVETAERLGCDAIVIATHGRSGWARLLLGSVAEYVVRHAPCPVLLVPARGRRGGRRRAKRPPAALAGASGGRA